LARVFAEDFSLNYFIRRQSANGCEQLRAKAGGARAEQISAVAPEKELILVPLQKSARLFLIPEQGVESRSSGKVPMKIWVITQEPGG
jgi:hypothetical protein